MSEIRNVAIIGAEMMGHSLAQVFAENLAELSPGPAGGKFFFQDRNPKHGSLHIADFQGFSLLRSLTLGWKGLSPHGNGFDFDLNISRKLFHPDTGSRQGIGRKEFAIDLVYFPEAGHIGQKNGRLDHFVQGEAGRFDNSLDVFQDGPCLNGEIFGDYFHRGGIDRNLSGNIDEISSAHGLGERRRENKSFGGGDDFFRIFPVPLPDPSVCRQAKVNKFFYNEFAT